MNCFQIEVRGVTFTIWAPTLQEAVETFMIDMEFYEVPDDTEQHRKESKISMCCLC